MSSDGGAKPERRAGGRRQVDDAFEDLLDTFTAHLDKVRYLAFGSQDTYANWVRDYYRWLVATEPALSLTDASPATIRAFVDFKRDQKIKPATIYAILQALNRFYDFLLLDDSTRPNPTKGVKGPKIIAAPIDPFSEDEVRQMLSLAQHYERSGDLRRWVGYVILVIFASTGVRNAELRNLLTENVNLSRHELRVLGKGSKERIIPFGAGAAEVLKTYAEELRPLLAPSPYFIVNPVSLRGPNWGRMGEGSLAILVKLLLTEAGIAGGKNPHRFRHSYATMVVRQTANLEVSRELLGHSDIKMTSHYVHMNSQDRHDAADKVDLVPRSQVTETAPPVTTPVSPSPPPTVTIEPGDTEDRSVELLPLDRPAPPQPLAAGHLVQDDQVATHRNLQDRTGEQLGEAVEIARLLPPRLLVHLNSERLVEVALGSCVTTGLNTEVFLATAGAVLSWAHDLPLPLAPLLAAYGTNVGYALAEVRSTLELLSGLDQPRRSSGPRR
jgi:integrase/recombinase XerC